MCVEKESRRSDCFGNLGFSGKIKPTGERREGRGTGQRREN
uniref:Uncharacterized protein n=1 Tax=Rhizophora mucronata TaxID=61149 RepID=A0A2P2QRL2_RHIMU